MSRGLFKQTNYFLKVTSFFFISCSRNPILSALGNLIKSFRIGFDSIKCLSYILDCGFALLHLELKFLTLTLASLIASRNADISNPKIGFRKVTGFFVGATGAAVFLGGRPFFILPSVGSNKKSITFLSLFQLATNEVSLLWKVEYFPL